MSNTKFFKKYAILVYGQQGAKTKMTILAWLSSFIQRYTTLQYQIDRSKTNYMAHGSDKIKSQDLEDGICRTPHLPITSLNSESEYISQYLYS